MYFEVAGNTLLSNGKALFSFHFQMEDRTRQLRRYDHGQPRRVNLESLWPKPE